MFTAGKVCLRLPRIDYHLSDVRPHRSNAARVEERPGSAAEYTSLANAICTLALPFGKACLSIKI